MSFASVAYAKVMNTRTEEIGEGYGSAVSADQITCDYASKVTAAKIAVYIAATNANCQNDQEVELIEGQSACVNVSPDATALALAFTHEASPLVERIVKNPKGR